MQTLTRRIALLVAIVAAFATVQVSSLAAQTAQTAQSTAAGRPVVALPDRLSDAEFWKLVGDISEPGGFFGMADNFVSNERDIGLIAGMIRANGPTGGVYMGVGPEQNFTYIAAVRPKMVFIVDIRRQAVIHHLMYKAIFELSRDRAAFISMLFAKPTPPALDNSSTIVQMWQAFASIAVDTAAAKENLARIREHLTRTHGFTLTLEEMATLDHVYNSFVRFGPEITDGGPSRGGRAGAGNVNITVRNRAIISNASADSAIAAVRGAAAAALYGQRAANGVTGSVPGASSTLFNANFAGLTSVTDATGAFDSFLGSEESYLFLKDLHSRNLFVPNSGNFGGPKAIRAVGSYVRAHGATISAFYVSNVEQYLFPDGIAGVFYENVATLPVDEKSVFIRPGGMRAQMALCPIATLLRAAAAGRIVSYPAATQCAQ